MKGGCASYTPRETTRKGVRITIWDDDHGAIEYELDPRSLEIVKDCLEAGLESYEEEQDADGVRDLLQNL